MNWPESSIDLKPLKIFWLIMNAKIAKNKQGTKIKLKEYISRVWYHGNGHNYTEKLIFSMPDLYRAIIAAHEESTLR